MDPFAIRLDFLSLLRKLNASQGSIAKLLSFSTLHAAKARGDIWSCIVSECSKTNLNSRLNILFLIDAILSSSAVAASAATSMNTEALDVGGYQVLVARDLRQVMSLIVPATWEGIRLNADSANKVLATWKAKRFFDPLLMQQIDEDLAAKQEELAKAPLDEARGVDLTEADVLRRIEEDRERHKRLRERGWILPSKSFLDALPCTSSNGSLRMGARSTPVSLKVSPASPRDAPPPRSAAGKRNAPAALPPPATKRLKTAPPTVALANGVAKRVPDAADIEFDVLWETTSDLHDDDLEAMREEDTRWWGGSKSIERRDEQMRQQEEKRRRLAEEEEEEAERARLLAEQEQRVREEEEERHRAKVEQQLAKEMEIQREQQHQYHHHSRHALPAPPSMWPARHSPSVSFEASGSVADIMPPQFHPIASPVTSHGFKYGNGPPHDSPSDQHNAPTPIQRHEEEHHEAPSHQRGARRSLPKSQASRSFGGGGGAPQGFSSVNGGSGASSNGNRWGRKGR